MGLQVSETIVTLFMTPIAKSHDPLVRDVDDWNRASGAHCNKCYKVKKWCCSIADWLIVQASV